MTTVNLHAAKTQFSRLVDRAAAGEEIIIAKAGKPAARLVPLAARQPRRLGGLEGQFTIPDDFDDMFAEEIIKTFEGG